MVMILFQIVKISVTTRLFGASLNVAPHLKDSAMQDCSSLFLQVKLAGGGTSCAVTAIMSSGARVKGRAGV